MADPPAMHPFDRGLIVVAAVFLAAALAGILDGPRRKNGEGFWRRRMLIVTALLGGGYFVVAALRFGDHFLYGRFTVGSLGRMVTPMDWAVASVDCLMPAAAGFLAILGGLLAAWSVTTACRKGRLHAIAGTAALLLVLAAFEVAVKGDLPGGRDDRVAGFIPEVCIPGEFEEFVGAVTMFLLPIVAIVLIAALVRLFRSPEESGPRPAAVARVLAAGTFAAAFGLLRLDLIVVANLRQFAILGPLAPRSFWGYLQDALVRSPVSLAVAGLGLIAVGFGFPALRLRREQKEEAAGGGPAAP